MHLIGVTPVKNELSDLRPREFFVDLGKVENVITLRTGLPVIANAPGQCVVLDGGRILAPLPADMLDETRIPGTIGGTSFAPVKHEFWNGIFNELRVDA